MRRTRAVPAVGVLAALVLVAALAYVYGAAQCPPPDWWFRLFLVSGNYACVA